MKQILTLVLVNLFLISFAQEKSPYTKFGSVSAADLNKKEYKIDSSANAVILCDIQNSKIQGNTKGWFSLNSKRHIVIHILNKNAYDMASIEIPLYVSGNSEEKVNNLKAVTYNLENGKVIETKLDKKDQFLEKVDKNRKKLKFTMPQVKEGSIIEVQYDVLSDFISVLDPWYFQSLKAPTLWSEITFGVPSFYAYSFLSRGYLPFTYKDNKNRTENFVVFEDGGTISSGRTSFDAGVTDYRWVIANAPELKEESYTSTLRNHIARMEFQLASQSSPLAERSFRSSWPEITKGLLESESFGEKLNASNNWMASDIKPLYTGINNNFEVAKSIYKYVRDNFKCNDQYGIYMEQSLKDVFKSRQGSVQEINLLLTAMLRYAGLEANPVLLSTRWHGYAYEFSPLISSMNYLIVQYNEAGKIYYLDASSPRLGFAKLPYYAYNGHGRVITETAPSINLGPDDLLESSSSHFYIANSNEGKWGGSVTQKKGYYESLTIRNEVAKSGKESYFKELQKKFGTTATLSDGSIDSLDKYEVPLALKYLVEFANDGEEILYVNPNFGLGYKKNPFASEERTYPVEMPYVQEETITATIEVPKGYKVDELPKQMILKLDPTGNTFYEYRLSQSGNQISFSGKLKIAHTTFKPQEYPLLREFFSQIVKKQNEQIVFKKIP